MLKDITIGQYFPGSSPVHRMDPRFKLIMTLLFIAMLFMGQHLYSICFGIVFCILALALSRIPVKLIWKSIKPLIPVLLITAILDLFMVDSGDVYLHWHFLKITAGGVRTAVLMVTRIIVLLAGSSLLTYTTSPIALTDAIERLLSPLKKLHVPVHTFAMMMSISLRFIPTLLEETDKIMSGTEMHGEPASVRAICCSVPRHWCRFWYRCWCRLFTVRKNWQRQWNAVVTAGKPAEPKCGSCMLPDGIMQQ